MFEILIFSLVQVITFSIIPVIWWSISARKKASFFSWIGLKKIKTKSELQFLALFISCVTVSCVLLYFLIPIAIGKSKTAITIQYSGKGLSALPSAIVFSFIQTGLSEEILFRGFLGKRLISKFGFPIGNTVQSLIFGLFHGVLFFACAGVLGGIILTSLTGAIGWAEGYLDEKKSDGSILTSTIFHGITNLLPSLLVM